MISEVFFFFLTYYATGLLLAVYFFHNSDAWEGTPSEHGAAVVLGVFLFNLIWPVMFVIMMALSFRREIRIRQQRIQGVYYGGEYDAQPSERGAR
jgi:hypothetical protein